MIKASVRSDDFQTDADFDATPWFEQASGEAIIALAQCNWGGDYPADMVAQWMADDIPAINVVMAHAGNHTEPGFEAHIDPTQALEWVKEHRPTLFPKLEERVYEVEYTVRMKARVTVGVGESLRECAEDTDIPENLTTDYVEGTFEIEGVELDQQPVDLDTGEIVPKL